MKKVALSLILMSLLTIAASAQQQEQSARYVADTLVVGAEGQYEMAPDLATLTFEVTAQEKVMKDAYQKASEAIRKIVAIAEKNGVAKDSIQTGALSLTPFYEGDRKKRAKSYLVQSQIVLKLRDFAKIGPVLDDSVEEGVIDFRSLTYSIADEEAAKQRAVAEAMRRAVGRATVALEQSRQKLGPVRYVNLDVTKLVSMPVQGRSVSDLMLVQPGVGQLDRAPQVPQAPPPMPMIKPEMITIRATVQCVFQIL